MINFFGFLIREPFTQLPSSLPLSNLLPSLYVASFQDICY